MRNLDFLRVLTLAINSIGLSDLKNVELLSSDRNICLRSCVEVGEGNWKRFNLRRFRGSACRIVAWFSRKMAENVRNELLESDDAIFSLY